MSDRGDWDSFKENWDSTNTLWDAIKTCVREWKTKLSTNWYRKIG